MLIDCPACTRSYHVSREEIGNEGRTLICPRCETRWFVDGTGRAREEVQATAISTRVLEESTPNKPAKTRGSFFASIRSGIAVGICMASLMLLLGARERVVRFAPRLARVYALAGLPVNVRGLEFGKVASTRVDPARLAVVGEIRNVTERRVAVPRISYEIRDAAGIQLVRWTERAATKTIAAGQTLAFAATPHDVPLGGETVRVHFEP